MSPAEAAGGSGSAAATETTNLLEGKTLELDMEKNESSVIRDCLNNKREGVTFTYSLVPEGLHQADGLLHRQGESEVRS